MPPPAAAPDRPGHQFYVTHCGKTDSVLNNPGWSVRAASAADPALARLALEYPPYELPIEMWSHLPSRDDAPRRLARSAGPGGRVWVVHSSYLEKDTMGRDRSYFTHALLLPAEVAGPAAVLGAWAAPGWATDYSPGAPKALGPVGLPVGPAVSDRVVTAFAGTGRVPTPKPRAVCVCPDRLQAVPDLRRDLLGRFLTGLMAAVADPGRGRLFVHAEPGLVALLTYAATRVLPPGWVDDLTFSTFEPAHRGLREFARAVVVGTYLGHPGKGLDADLTGSVGYGLDTFHPERSSAELRGPVPAGLRSLVDLAAAGDWPGLDRFRRLRPSGRPGAKGFPKLLELARTAGRLADGSASPDDLLSLRADPGGAAELTRAGAAVWPVVRDAAPGSKDIRTGFAALVREPAHAAEVRNLAVRGLVAGDLGEWDRWWAVLRDAGDAGFVGPQLDAVAASLGPDPFCLPDAVRDRVRREFAAAGRPPGTGFLIPTGPAELHDLLAAPWVPADWRGFAAYVLAAGRVEWLPPAARPHLGAMRDAVRHRLLSADDGTTARCLVYARKHAPDPAEGVRGCLGFLFVPGDPACRGLFARLLVNEPGVLAAEEWDAACAAVGFPEGEAWDEFVADGGRVAAALAVLPGTAVGRALWVRAAVALGRDLPFAGGAELLPTLRKLADVDPPPESAANALRAAEVVLDALNGAVPSPGELRAAFQVLWDPPAEALAEVYRRRFAAAGTSPGALAPFARLVMACYPLGDTFRASHPAIAAWLGAGQNLPPGDATRFQRYFLETHVRADMWAAVLDSDWPVPLEEDVAVCLRAGRPKSRGRSSSRVPRVWLYGLGGLGFAGVVAATVLVFRRSDVPAAPATVPAAAPTPAVPPEPAQAAPPPTVPKPAPREVIPPPRPVTPPGTPGEPHP